ncbi:MAG TPA: DUF2793 domain-containing protein [Allosphingosinicella sp.]|jgi:hypothetical protein
MTEATPRFALPFILPGQAQKELFHNEALLAADALLHPAAETPPLADPPPAPEAGQSWIVAAQGTGAWTARDHDLATWCDGGWRFASPVAGMRIWIKSLALWVHWTGSAWSDGELRGSRVAINGQQVVGARQPGVPSPSGGTIIDAEARSALAGVIVALRSHGLID